MSEPKLHAEYDCDEAIAIFGRPAKARSLCNGQWVVLPGFVLGFVEVGEPPRSSHFGSGGVFRWVPDKLDRDVPPEILGDRASGRSIRLFVRSSGRTKYLYVGELGPPCSHWSMNAAGDNRRLVEVSFDLSSTLPSAIWGGLGGSRPGDLDHKSVDAALGRLRGSTTVQERLEILRRVVEYWHGPIRPEDGIPEKELAGLDIPRPLRWWYQTAGRRPEIMSGQNFLKVPRDLSILDGKLLFYVENQECYLWGTDPAGDDPPVFGYSKPPDPWEPEGIRLSEHLILACLFEAIMLHSPYGASTSWLGESVLNAITEHVPPIAIGPWRWCGSTRFYAGNGAFMYTMDYGELSGERGYSVWIGAKTEHPLQFLKPFIDERWEYSVV